MWHFFTCPDAVAQRRRPRAADILIAAATFAGWFVLLSHGDRFETTDLVLLAASTLPLAGWRISPASAFTASTIAALGLAVRGQVLWPPLGSAVALYLLTASRDTATSWSRRSAATVMGLLVGYLTLLVAAVGWVASDLAHLVLGCTAAWFAGERSRLRRQQIADLHDRAHRATEAAAAQMRLAVAEERARIARDLHDSAGHALNVIAVRAGAARLRGDPGRALTALTDIETVARDTVADIDQIIGSLRASETRPASDDDSPIGLASADTLVAQHQAAGLRVTISRQGDPASLGKAVDQAAYRILQEALTNAARHGTGSASITIRTDGEGCALTVTNPAGDPQGVAPGGHGIAGMRERAHLLGGTLTAGRSGDEFQIRLRLPHSRPAP